MQEHRLTAIMFTDIVGYTAMMGKDEVKTHKLLNRNREIHQSLIRKYNGTLLKEIGDGMMYGMMVTKKYTLPPVLAEIGRDSSDVIIQQSNGLDIPELKPEGYYGTDNRSMMMQ